MIAQVLAQYDARLFDFLVVLVLHKVAVSICQEGNEVKLDVVYADLFGATLRDKFT